MAKRTAGGPALFEDRVAIRVKKRPHGVRCMPGDIVELKDGTLLMSYTKNNDNGISAVKSNDQGRTWGRPFDLIRKAKPPARGAYRISGFLRLPNGDILLSYIYTTHPTTPYYGHNYYRRSADEGRTWTEQFILTPHPGYCIVANDRMLRLSTGRIVVPAEYKAHMPSTRDHSGYVGITFFSDDDGHSWQVSRNAVDMYPIEVQEADVVELKDGRLMMFARTYSGFPVRAYSKDGGASWSKGRKMAKIEMPYAGLPSVKRIPSTGDLLFIWISERSIDKDDPRIHRRCALTCAVSKDEGKTFGHFRHIARDPEDDFGYQSVTFIGKDLAVISYHARNGLHVARIGIDWFYGR